MAAQKTSYFLFPHLTLPEADWRDLSVFLPNLQVLQAVRPPAIPEFSRSRFAPWPVLDETGLAHQVESCINGYRAFAEVHGSGRALAYLARAMDQEGETRIRIQQEIRGACPPGLSASRLELFQAAVFLELARDLDEKELEIEAGYEGLNLLEAELRAVLGVSGEDGLIEAAEAISPPLGLDRGGLGFMLRRRICAWLQLFFSGPAVQKPVFVTMQEETASEISDLFPGGLEGEGKPAEVLHLPLGSFPRLDQLGSRQFRSFAEGPGLPELLASYWRDLDSFFGELGEAVDIPEIEHRTRVLSSALAAVPWGGATAEGPRMTLSLILLGRVKLDSLARILPPAGRPVPGAGPDLSRPAIFLCLS